MSIYRTMINAILAEIGRSEVESRHVEAMMRVEHPTLDALSAARFRREVIESVAAIDQAGPDLTEQIAESYGLGVGR